MTADNPSSWSVKNGLGIPLSAQITTDTFGNITPQFALRTNGEPVETNNALPVADSQTALSATALGTPADAVWSGTGNSSIIAALKAVWTVLTGTLKTQLQTGTNTIGAVTFPSAQPVSGTFFQATQPVTDTQTALTAVALGTPADATWAGTGSSSVVAALKAIWSKTGVASGSVGADFSSTTNHTALPSSVGTTVGTSTYGGSGPFAAYVLVASAAANASRANIDVENISGSQVVVVRDDGTAAAGSAPVNASWFLLAGGGTGPSQGGAWSSTTFRGRIQLWMATVPTYPPTVMGD
jgi:hypothetical protein